MRDYPTTTDLAERTAELFRCARYYARKAPDDLDLARDVAEQAWALYGDLMAVTEAFETFNAYPPDDVGRALNMVILAGNVLTEHAPPEMGDLKPFPPFHLDPDDIPGYDPDATERPLP